MPSQSQTSRQSDVMVVIEQQQDQPSEQANVVVITGQRPAEVPVEKPTAAVAKASGSMFPILELPAEIRLRVWRLLLVYDSPIRLRKKSL